MTETIEELQKNIRIIQKEYERTLKEDIPAMNEEEKNNLLRAFKNAQINIRQIIANFKEVERLVRNREALN